MSQADGQEVLVVDGDENVQRGLQNLLIEAQLIPTVLADVDRAQALAREKYFAAAIVDLDTPRPNGALPLIAWLRKESPGTAVIVLTARTAFEVVVEAFRTGATDVVMKSQTEIEYLRKRIVEICADVRVSASNDRLLVDVFALHEDFLKRLMETSRRAAELEEKLGGGAQSTDADEVTRVLLVEPPDDGWLSRELSIHVQAHGGFALHTLGTGGEALDAAGSQVFQIALVRDTLPDLPGTMVVNTIKAASPETITILVSKPEGDLQGRADIVEGSRVIPLVADLVGAQQLAARLDELRQAFSAKSRERRYLAAFRQRNYELLKRFADLKQKLKRAAYES